MQTLNTIVHYLSEFFYIMFYVGLNRVALSVTTMITFMGLHTKEKHDRDKMFS